MSEEQSNDHADDLRRQMRDAIAQASMSPSVRKRKLVFWAARQMLLCALAWYFWDKTWMRWVFWTGVAVAVINLVMILLMPSFLATQRRKGTRALDRLEVWAREDQSDPQEGAQR